jgi:hypothetical protein
LEVIDHFRNWCSGTKKEKSSCENAQSGTVRQILALNFARRETLSLIQGGRRMDLTKVAIPAIILSAGLLVCTSSIYGTPDYGKKEKRPALTVTPKW